jgi:hypothetical protein
MTGIYGGSAPWNRGCRPRQFSTNQRETTLSGTSVRVEPAVSGGLRDVDSGLLDVN